MIDNVKMIHSDALFAEVREQLKNGNEAMIRVSGMSMWPFICHGRDSVILKHIEDKDIRVGDIVILQKPDGAYLLHRVTAMNSDSIQTTGDGLIYRDEWVPKDTVFGVVTCIIRKGRQIPCDAFHWKIIMTIWRWAFPIRNFLLNILMIVSKVRHS